MRLYETGAELYGSTGVYYYCYFPEEIQIESTVKIGKSRKLDGQMGGTWMELCT